MNSISVFSCIPLPEHVMSAMQGAFHFVVVAAGDQIGQLNRRTAAGEHFDAVLTGLGADLLDAKSIAALPSSIRIIATYSVGTDHIDLEAARAKGIAVSNTPGTLVNAVADAAMFLTLAAARRATESIALIRSRAWPGWNPDQLLGIELSGRTMGIYGMGEIGTAIAHRARAFGMAIAYSNRRPMPDEDATFIADAPDLVEAADVLMIAAPSTPETRGFVNASTLARAKPSLILINIARGELVVDADLIAALAGRRIFAAGLDVFAGEPDVAAGYFDLPNVVMTPHIGSSTREARAAMGESAIRSIRAFFAGEADPSRLF